MVVKPNLIMEPRRYNFYATYSIKYLVLYQQNLRSVKTNFLFFSNQITKCLNEIMEPGFDYTKLERHEKVDCMK